MIQTVSSPAIKYFAAALAAVLVFGGSYVKGRVDGTNLTEARYAEEKRKWELAVLETQTELELKLANIREEYLNQVQEYKEQIEKLQNNPKVVTQYVDRYVPVKTQCTIPEGFVELHNRSASGLPLDPPPQNPNKPSNKTLNNTAAIIAENYYKCNELIARLNALQQLVIEYQKKQEELTK